MLFLFQHSTYNLYPWNRLSHTPGLTVRWWHCLWHPSACSSLYMPVCEWLGIQKSGLLSAGYVLHPKLGCTSTRKQRYLFRDPQGATWASRVLGGLLRHPLALRAKYSEKLHSTLGPFAIVGILLKCPLLGAEDGEIGGRVPAVGRPWVSGKYCLWSYHLHSPENLLLLWET